MTATTTAALAAVLLAGGSLPARADETRPSAHEFEIGFRTGASFPVGDTESGVTLSGHRGVQFPLWLDIGYRIGDVVVGAVSQFTNYNISWSYPNTRWFSERSVHSWITIGVKLTGLL